MLKKALGAALSAQKLATDKSETLASIRAAAQNEWRATVSDLIASQRGEQKGHSDVLGWLVGAVGFAGMLVSIVLILAGR